MIRAAVLMGVALVGGCLTQCGAVGGGSVGGGSMGGGAGGVAQFSGMCPKFGTCRICVMGDSTSARAHAYDGGPGGDGGPELTWPEKLATELGTRDAGPTVAGYEVVSHALSAAWVWEAPGFSGSEGMYEAQWPDCKADSSADVIVIMGGLNPIIQAGDTAADTLLGIDSLVTETQQNRRSFLLLTATPAKGSGNWTAGRQTELDSYNSSIISYDGGPRVFSGDSYTWLEDPGTPDTLLRPENGTDFLHFDAVADDTMADKVATCIVTGVCP